MTDFLPVFLRVAAATAAFGYAAYLVIRLAPWARPSAGVTDADLRAVLALAARFRAAGRPQAVRLCQQLLDELLGGEAPR